MHGRYAALPGVRHTVQRIRYADNETNYCPRCQTEGRLLADRSLSRLLKDDWPRTIEELERRGAPAAAPESLNVSAPPDPSATRTNAEAVVEALHRHAFVQPVREASLSLMNMPPTP